MHINRNLFGIVCRAAAFSFLAAGTASLMYAQQASSAQPALRMPLLLASSSAVPDFTAASLAGSSSSSSSSSEAVAGDGLDLSSAALGGSQPPPRRYGRPNYSSGNTNPDGSNKYTFIGGGGLDLPLGSTHKYETPSWGFQVGGGRNFNKTVGVLLQFDYDHFGLQGATLANQEFVYNYYCTPSLQSAGICSLVTNLDGNNHVWSFTLNPTFTIPTEGSLGAYVVVGGGFYHKVTNFTLPSSECLDYYCDYQVTVQQNVDHYISNAAGFNGGFGLTYKFSKFSNQRFYMEARYVMVLNQHYNGSNSSNVGTSFGTTYSGTDFYPANTNRTTYIPVKFGLRF